MVARALPIARRSRAAHLVGGRLARGCHVAGAPRRGAPPPGLPAGVGGGEAAGGAGGGVVRPVGPPDEAPRHIPLLDRDRLHGALHVPSDGVAKGGAICHVLQEGAEQRGATFIGRTRATGIDMEGGRVRAVATDRGAIRTSTALVCLGLWAPEFMRS